MRIANATIGLHIGCRAGKERKRWQRETSYRAPWRQTYPTMGDDVSTMAFSQKPLHAAHTLAHTCDFLYNAKSFSFVQSICAKEID